MPLRNQSASPVFTDCIVSSATSAPTARAWHIVSRSFSVCESGASFETSLVMRMGARLSLPCHAPRGIPRLLQRWTFLHAGYSVAGFTSVFVMGLLYSWQLWRSGSLRVPLLCHAVHNGLINLSP